jgi:hypothetical protein
MKILSLLIFLLSFVPCALAQSGYEQHPWGSNTWVGHGRPPHWSPVKPTPSQEAKSSTKKGKYFRGDKHGQLYTPSHKSKIFRRTPIYIQKSAPATIIREKTVITPRYIPVPNRSSTNICGGDTVSMRDNTTGILTIHYVSPAQACE